MSGQALEEMRNLGPETAKRLRALGIMDEDDLRKDGAVVVYCKLKLAYPDITANALIAVQGALMDVDWREIPGPLSDELKREAWDTLRHHKKTTK